MKIDLIAGARPNFIKISPIIDAIKKENNRNKTNIQYRFVHTGQHYNESLSGSFFKQLKIPLPDINLDVGSGTQAQQTGKIMKRYENLLQKESTDYCLVVGDVTSTMACSIVAKKMGIKIIHVEGGIRSGDMAMPEEINRILTDSITDYFFTTSQTANTNLINNGFSKDSIFFVGNTMIDTLKKHQYNLKKPSIWSKTNLKKSNYLIVTLHRPSNVDKKDILKKILKKIIENSNGIPVIFPVHPRTMVQLKKIGVFFSNLHITEPLSYLEFNYLVKNAKAVITDSGGISEETTVMNIPCLTLRNNTERPETVDLGTNELIGTEPKALGPAMKKIFNNNWKTGSVPHLWDGKTSERIIQCLIKLDDI
jgi:UDP-N-acetylglucosamine 2-epimerase (non-hydrolysing)